MSNEELNYSDMNWCKETIESLRWQLAECQGKLDEAIARKDCWNRSKDAASRSRLINQLAAVTKQRDELAEALALADGHMKLYLIHYRPRHNVFDAVSEALAKVCADKEE